MIVLLNLVIASLLSLMSGSIAWVFSVALIVPFFSMQIRRIRDTGRAWPWIFISLVPLIGQIWLLWILIGPSDDQIRSPR